MNLKLEMTTKEIEVLTGKRHDNILVDCEKMFAHLKIQAGDFLDSYLDANNQARKMYRLDKDLTMTLITKYDTARRYAVVRRWRERLAERFRLNPTVSYSGFGVGPKSRR